MKQKLLLIMALTAMTLAAEAQRIDFCAINRSDAECLEPGYQKWAFDRVASATGTFTADYHNMIEGVGSAPSPLKVVVNGHQGDEP